MSTAGIVIRASIKMIAIWTGLAAIGIPLAKVSIEIAYKIWSDRNEY